MSSAREKTDELLPVKHAKSYGDYASIGAQIGLGIIGAGAGFLYLGPAEACSVSETCGKWLTDLTNQKIAISVFMAGGVDFSGINAYFSAQSINRFQTYIQKQKSNPAKIGKSTIIIVFALSQNVQLLLSSLKTSTAAWQTVLTVSGGAPGALFGAVGLVEQEIPYFLSKVNQAIKQLRYTIADFCSPLSETEKHYRNEIIHYSKLQSTFLKKMQANWKQIITQTENIEINSRKPPLTFLFGQKAPVQSSSWFSSLLHKISQLAGMGLAINFSVPILANTFHSLGEYLPKSLQFLFTGFLSSSLLYGHFKITNTGVDALLTTLAQLLTGKPIDSTTFQLGTKRTILTASAAVLASTLSYAVINLLFEKEFPGEDVGARQAFRYGGNIGIDIYHLIGLMHFYHLIFSVMAKDEKKVFLFAIEKEIERLSKMTLEEFKEFVQKNNSIDNELYGLETYEETIVDEENPDIESQSLLENKTAKQTTSSGWFSMFTSSTTQPAQRKKGAYVDLPLPLQPIPV